MLKPNDKALLSIDDLEGIVFDTTKKAEQPIILTENEDLASYVVKVTDAPAAMPIAPTVDKYAAMCDLLKGKAADASTLLPQSTNEILNRVVNKLYDLAQDIKLTMSGY